VSPETLREILAGWGQAGADSEPTYTANVEEHTSVSDAVGRETKFFEELGLLEPHKQRHQLTEAGEQLAGALAAGDGDRAKARAREVLSDWELTEDVRGLLEGPTSEETLVPLVAELAEQDLNTSRVGSGLSTLLDLYDWAGVLERDDEGRYRLPEGEPEPTDTEEDGSSESEPDGTETEAAEAEFGTDSTSTEVEAATESVESAVAAAELATAATEVKEAAEAAREAAEHAQAAAKQGSLGDDPASEPHTVSLDLDVDADDLEAIVRGLKGALVEEQS